MKTRSISVGRIGPRSGAARKIFSHAGLLAYTGMTDVAQAIRRVAAPEVDQALTTICSTIVSGRS